LDLFLSYASDKHREQFARVFARVNKAIETLDNDALKKAAASACKGLDVIGETIAERGLEPPDVRYLGLDGLILAETAEDAKRLRDHFEGSPRIYSLAEFALIVEKFEVENSTVKAAKEILGGRVEAICERTPLEQELNDCVPF
jgi:hypothetical protein